jgi:hypothetical protein
VSVSNIKRGVVLVIDDEKGMPSSIANPSSFDILYL